MPDRKSSPSRIITTNSNTRVSTGQLPRRNSARQPSVDVPRPANSNTRVAPGLPARTPAGSQANATTRLSAVEPAFEGLRQRMVQGLRGAGISDERVLAAMSRVPRHRFVDEGLASRAYENAALPIGAGQTISQPWIVARMLSAALVGGPVRRALEVGTGCGYQAALMAQLTDHVVSIERVRSLHDQARERLRALRVAGVQLVLGDGQTGWPADAPYDVILVAAAGIAIPQALLAQLAPGGGRLLAPEGSGSHQRLVMIERLTQEGFRRTELEAVRFVPLQTGVQL